MELLKKNLSFLILIFSLLAFRWSFADQYVVPTGSMQPTIHEGDHILVNKMAYDLKVPFTNQTLFRVDEVNRGDVVVFLFPEDTSKIFVKRVIALPGDHVEIENGSIKINGSNLAHFDLQTDASEKFYSYQEVLGSKTIHIRRDLIHPKVEKIDVVVPTNHYFVMGDNRDNSYDSRYWGFVPRENIKGQAKFVGWNFKIENFHPEMELGRSGVQL